MQARVEGVERGRGRLKQAFERAIEAGAHVGEARTRVRQVLARIVAQHCGGQVGSAIAAQAQECGEGKVEALDQVIEALIQAVEQGSDARFGAAHGKAREPLARLEQLKTRGALQPMRLRGQMLGDFVLGFGDQFGCGRRRGRAQVGDEVRDGEVGLMPDGGNHRKSARCNGARDALAVEGGQIFKGTAAAGQYDEVDEMRRRSARPARPQSRRAPIRPARRPGRGGRSIRSGGG